MKTRFLLLFAVVAVAAVFCIWWFFFRPSVALRVNGRHRPAMVDFGSVMQVSWKTTGKVRNGSLCRLGGSYMNSPEGRRWGSDIEVEPNGEMTLYAKDAALDYVNPLELVIVCPMSGKLVVDTVLVPVRANFIQTTRQKEIANLFRNIIGREPDAAGLKYWDDSGLSLDNIQSAFSGSTEYGPQHAFVVSSPKGGESYSSGSTQYFSWTPVPDQLGLIYEVHLMKKTDSSFDSVIYAGQPSSFDIKVPDVKSGADYFVHVKAIISRSVLIASGDSKTFSITQSLH